MSFEKDTHFSQCRGAWRPAEFIERPLRQHRSAPQYLHQRWASQSCIEEQTPDRPETPLFWRCRFLEPTKETATSPCRVGVVSIVAVQVVMSSFAVTRRAWWVSLRHTKLSSSLENLVVRVATNSSALFLKSRSRSDTWSNCQPTWEPTPCQPGESPLCLGELKLHLLDLCHASQADGLGWCGGLKGCGFHDSVTVGFLFYLVLSRGPTNRRLFHLRSAVRIDHREATSQTRKLLLLHGLLLLPVFVASATVATCSALHSVLCLLRLHAPQQCTSSTLPRRS